MLPAPPASRTYTRPSCSATLTGSVPPAGAREVRVKLGAVDPERRDLVGASVHDEEEAPILGERDRTLRAQDPLTASGPLSAARKGPRGANAPRRRRG